MPPGVQSCLPHPPSPLSPPFRGAQSCLAAPTGVQIRCENLVYAVGSKRILAGIDGARAQTPMSSIRVTECRASPLQS